MNNLVAKILCAGCPKRKQKIENSGSMYRVDYITFKSQKQYIILDNPNISWDDIMKMRDTFVSTYVPKFGKCEVEQFVGYKMMEALFITRDITGLLNSELLCDDSPFNVTRVNSARLKEEVLKCFEVVTGEEQHNPDIVRLVFKWKPYSKLK